MILIKPVVTEKSMIGVAEGRYVFVVNTQANKAEIAQAIFNLYKVKPVKVNIIYKKAEEKMVRGRYLAKIKRVKKAIITLKKGDKIPGFEEK
jgi:large subunit ribosomal protein L23